MTKLKWIMPSRSIGWRNSVIKSRTARRDLAVLNQNRNCHKWTRIIYPSKVGKQWSSINLLTSKALTPSRPSPKSAILTQAAYSTQRKIRCHRLPSLKPWKNMPPTKCSQVRGISRRSWNTLGSTREPTRSRFHYSLLTTFKRGPIRNRKRRKLLRRKN